jgi:IS30 family transposase
MLNIPYYSWERGLNENHNGLLRQFFPKRMALDNVSEKEVFRATDLMNNRPRKCLGYKTPFEVFAKMTLSKAIRLGKNCLNSPL